MLNLFLTITFAEVDGHSYFGKIVQRIIGGVKSLYEGTQEQATLELADQYFKKKKFKEAAEIYDQTSRSQNEKIRDISYLRLAELNRIQDKIDEALDYYKKSLESKNDEIKDASRLGLAQCALLQENPEEILSHSQKIFNASNQSIKDWAHYSAGEAYFMQSKFHLAISHFRTANGSKDLHIRDWSFYRMSICYMMIENIPLATANLKKVINSPIVEVRDRALFSLGCCLEAQQKQQEAEIYYKKALDSEIQEVRTEAKKRLKSIKSSDDSDDLKKYERLLEEKELSSEACAKAKSELKKLKGMSFSSPEHGIIKNYLEVLLNLPWGNTKPTIDNIDSAQAVLDKNHYGLKKAKDTIIEFLAVQSRTGKNFGKILCLAGPPGVGKTSLAKGIAEATGREFARISLGGVHDEAGIRGHRRTYVGAMPGRLIQSLKKLQTNNPVILLDEIDKVGTDKHHGDPSSALLEALDPEQNNKFEDHFLEVGFDLSNVLFIVTANDLKAVPKPLLDRMEIIWVSGYTEEEKMQIVKTYIIPKVISKTGLRSDEISFKDDALSYLIQKYTREAGVRNLERQIEKICRKIVLDITKKVIQSCVVDIAKIENYCGKPKYFHEHTDGEGIIGVTNGLAWTELGGELLKIEVNTYPGTGKIVMTGKLGDVMQESITTAISVIRSRANKLKVKETFYKDIDIHVHVPEGGTPKDGPSAGIGMFTSILSALSSRKVKHDIAMTGEISLQGRVLPIGGLKEKLLAAHRAGVKTVFIPYMNKKDLVDVPESVKKDINIVPIKHIDQLLPHIFV